MKNDIDRLQIWLMATSATAPEDWELLYIFIDEELWKEYKAISTNDGPETYMSDGLVNCNHILLPSGFSLHFWETNENAASDPPPHTLFHSSISKWTAIKQSNDFLHDV